MPVEGAQLTAGKGEPTSWYLDPAVARQKRQVHRELIHRWAREMDVRALLKTDLFEEANGADQILFDLYPDARLAAGMDLCEATVRRALRRCDNPSSGFLVCDVRHTALRPGCLDLVVSTSTLDHLDTAAEFRAALGELAGLLREGGLLIVTLDNPQNPLYHPFRWASRRGWAPFALGHTVSMSELNRLLADVGLEVVGNDWLLHNPRVISTVVFLGLRKLLKTRADSSIEAVLRLLERMERLPTRRWTACFIAACARRPLQRPGSGQEDCGRV
jgi:SAM-dependent methyltransferase